MSIFDEIDMERLKKEHAFCNEIREKFTKDEVLAFDKMRRKILETNRQLWMHGRRIGELEESVVKARKDFAKYRYIFFAAIIAFALITTLSGRSELDFGFIALGVGGFFAIEVLHFRTAEIASLTEISNLRIANSILRSHLAEFDLYLLPDISEYMKIGEDKGIYSNTLNEAESNSVSEFNVHLNLTVLQNMGYEIPTLWS